MVFRSSGRKLRMRTRILLVTFLQQNSLVPIGEIFMMLGPLALLIFCRISKLGIIERMHGFSFLKPVLEYFEANMKKC